MPLEALHGALSAEFALKPKNFLIGSFLYHIEHYANRDMEITLVPQTDERYKGYMNEIDKILHVLSHDDIALTFNTSKQVLQTFQQAHPDSISAHPMADGKLPLLEYIIRTKFSRVTLKYRYADDNEIPEELIILYTGQPDTQPTI